MDMSEREEEEEEDRRTERENAECIGNEENETEQGKDNENASAVNQMSSAGDGTRKPRTRTRQPNGTPMSHIRQKRSEDNESHCREPENKKVSQEAESAGVLTERQQMDMEADAIESMMNLVEDESVASSGEMITQN